MVGRTWALLRARLAMAHRSGWAIPSLFLHAVLGALFASLVADSLPPFGYALFALSIGAVFLALPLLSDLGALLRLDEGGEWVEALPARPAELRFARLAHLALVAGALELALVVPFALRAPEGVGRVALVLGGLGLATVLSAALIWVQALLWPRWDNLLIGLQALVLAAVVIGSAQLLGHLPEVARLTPDLPWLRFLPSAWFAGAVSATTGEALPILMTALAAGSLLFVPARPTRRGATGQGVVQRVLEPLRRLAGRSWVRAGERGAFDLVFLALPREREFRLRTLPVLGIPMAFLWIGLRGGEPGRSGDLLSILLFTVGVYLPVLLAHVPLTESPEASWLLRTAPRAGHEIAAGATKALFLRYLLPLHVVLAGVGLSMGAGELLVRLWPASTLCSLVMLQVLYPTCVRDLPLSIGPDQLRGDLDWLSRVAGIALGMTVFAVAANRLAGVTAGWVLAAALWVISVVLFRRARSPGT